MGGGDGPSKLRPSHIVERIPASSDAAVAVGSAWIAAGCLTPFVLTIDKAVVQAAAGTSSLSRALVESTKDIFFRLPALVKSPALYLVWGTYGLTYTAANMIDVVAERKQVNSATHGSAKLVGTTGVNMGASLVKDILFAKMFGKQEAGAAAQTAAKRSVPLSCAGFFMARDTLTIGAGFILPPIVARGLEDGTGMEKKTANLVAQLTTPMAMQLVCTPLHLLALNMYNTPSAPWSQRAQEVWATCPQTTFVRMGRFLCAYGFGGILNKELVSLGQSRNERMFVHCASGVRGRGETKESLFTMQAE